MGEKDDQPSSTIRDVGEDENRVLGGTLIQDTEEGSTKHASEAGNVSTSQEEILEEIIYENIPHDDKDTNHSNIEGEGLQQPILEEEEHKHKHKKDKRNKEKKDKKKKKEFIEEGLEGENQEKKEKKKLTKEEKKERRRLEKQKRKSMEGDGNL